MEPCYACSEPQLLRYRAGCVPCKSRYDKWYRSLSAEEKLLKRTARKEASLERASKMMELYLGGVRVDEIAEMFQTTIFSVNDARRLLGVSKRPRHIYEINEGYFSTCVTENQAYWLGFLLADGNVYKGSLSLKLQAKDVGHLHKLRSDLSSTHPIEESTTWCRFRAYSKPLASDLYSLGVTPAKSATATPPTLPEHLVRHFWRGVVDGDGWVTDRHIGLCGSFNVVSGFAAFLKDFGVTSALSVRQRGPHFYQLDVGSQAFSSDVVRELYFDSKISLDRKMDKALVYHST